MAEEISMSTQGGNNGNSNSSCEYISTKAIKRTLFYIHEDCQFIISSIGIEFVDNDAPKYSFLIPRERLYGAIPTITQKNLCIVLKDRTEYKVAFEDDKNEKAYSALKSYISNICKPDHKQINYNKSYLQKESKEKKELDLSSVLITLIWTGIKTFWISAVVSGMFVAAVAASSDSADPDRAAKLIIIFASIITAVVLTVNILGFVVYSLAPPNNETMDATKKAIRRHDQKKKKYE